MNSEANFSLVAPQGIDPWSHGYQPCALPLSYGANVLSIYLFLKKDK